MRLLPDGDGTTAVVAVRRLTSEEAALEEVHVHPDLTALEELALGEELVLTTGGEAVFDHDAEPCALVGPSGWLGRAAVGGDVVVLRWDGSTLHVTSGPEEPPFDEVSTARLQRVLLAAFEADQFDLEEEEDDEDDDERGGEDIEFSGIAELVADVDEDHPGVFATLVPPLSEVLEGAGLEVRGELVGRPGTRWDVLDKIEEVVTRLSASRSEHVRSPRAFAAVDALVDAFEEGLESADDARAMAALFAVEPGVAPAVFDEIADRDESFERAEAFAHELLDAARAGTAAGAAWMLASAAEARGDVAAQERWLSRSLSADGDYLPALLDASWCASDRGDASRAASLLGAAGLGRDDTWLRRLQGFARPGPLAAARNEPCPCGSGRKYKACCARSNGWSLAARASWVYDKAALYLDRSGGGPDWDDLGDVDDLDALLLLDLALFEGGVLSEFVARRGALLPADERALATSWLGSRRGVFEITEVRPGEGMTVEDVMTGVSTTLEERLGSQSVRRHQLVCLRLLPTGAGSVAIFGPVVVVGPGTERTLAAVLRDGTALDIARSWADSQRPPTMRTASGEDLAIARAVYDVETPGELARVETLEPDVGSITVVGRRVEIQAMAPSALEAVEALVLEAAPGARLADRVVVKLTPGVVTRMRSRARPDDEDDDGWDESPEAVEALAAFIREREDLWPDEPLPALGGRTAREACADEDGRREVRRLLANFGPAGRGTMDPDRLRAILGL